MQTHGLAARHRTSIAPLAAGAAALLLALAACSRTSEDPLERATRSIRPERIAADGRKLAADDMAGRYYASPEADSAAAYILARLRACHIAPTEQAEKLLGAEPASFAHHFSVTLYRIGSRTRLGLIEANEEHPAVLGHDFLPLVFARGEAVEGAILHVTRGAGSVEVAAAKPLAGRVVLVDRPPGHGAAADDDAALYRQALRLEDAGAAAVLFAADANLLHTFAATYPSNLSPEQEAAATSARGSSANLRADRLSLAAQAQAWLEATRPSIPALVVRSGWADRLQDGDVVRLRVDLEPEVSLGENILVGFRGRARPDDLVVLGANYDHAGINAAGEVLNGADDNATGVAALLEIAAALTEVRATLERSVLLVFFSAGREGLQGSEMLLHDLPQLLGPRAHPVVMLALRGLGRNDARPMLLVGGTRLPGLAGMLEHEDQSEVLGSPPLPLQRTDDEATTLARLEMVPSHGSEHLSFVRGGVPSLLLTDGLDPMLYGQPDDDWKYVDADKVARAARLAFRAVYDLATDLRPTTAAALTRTP